MKKQCFRTRKKLIQKEIKFNFFKINYYFCFDIEFFLGMYLCILISKSSNHINISFITIAVITIKTLEN
jgi:hypothetical protein